MFETSFEFIGLAVDSIVNSIYIGLLAYSFCYAFYKPTINDLITRTNNLEGKQEILYQAIGKLRNIIEIDKDFSNDQTEQLKEIKKEIQAINKILNIKQTKYDDEDEDEDEDEDDEESTSDSNDQESDDTIPSPKNKPALPVQNHIVFPHFFILNDKNFKQKKISDNTYELRFIGDDLRVISNQLAKFIKVKVGTCMEFEEAYNYVYNYIQENDIINISEDTQLCRLFGITGNEDYECSDSMIIKVLKKMLEPHFKKITYECVTK
jgi:peptidoglycan hydrolase-like protein with peptidoglycan-binding domain